MPGRGEGGAGLRGRPYGPQGASVNDAIGATAT